MRADDIQPGKYVTVKDWANPPHEADFSDLYGEVQDGPFGKVVPWSAVEKHAGREHDGAGRPFLVVEVSLPYVAVMYMVNGAKALFDTRKVELQPVSRKYAHFFVDRQAYKKRYPSLFVDDVESMAKLCTEEGERIMDSIVETDDVEDNVEPMPEGEIRQLLEEEKNGTDSGAGDTGDTGGRRKE